ncbi:MAG TPA: PaaI family thioesterase [Pyrinomonadaceae bacterium]|nr:PaaI family thioesterase [Pyrinomonadaceae bacterium]
MSKTDLEDSRLQRARNAFARVAYAKFLGLELCELKSGDVTVCLNVRDDVKQNHGVVHGGAIASLIDTASAFVILTAIDENERVTTTDLTIHYLRPVTAGRMLARARIVRGGRRRFVVHVEVENEGRLAATAVTGYVKI